MTACDYCRFRNSWDCGDGWNRRKNCENFTLDWDMLNEKEKKTIQKILDNKETGEYMCEWGYEDEYM